MAQDIEVIKFIEKAIYREQRQKWIASVLLFTAGVVLVYHFFESHPLIAMIGSLGLVLGIRYMYLFFPLWRGRDFHLLYLIEYRPKNIVWVYSIVTERLPFGLQFSRNATLYFKLLDGKEYSVTLPASRIKAVSHSLNTLLPHATFGYNKDREQLYIVDPSMLLKEE